MAQCSQTRISPAVVYPRESFLGLSLELRNIVYSFVFTDLRLQLPRPGSNDPSGLACLIVCRQYYAEARPRLLTFAHIDLSFFYHHDVLNHLQFNLDIAACRHVSISPYDDRMHFMSPMGLEKLYKAMPKLASLTLFPDTERCLFETKSYCVDVVEKDEELDYAHLVSYCHGGLLGVITEGWLCQNDDQDREVLQLIQAGLSMKNECRLILKCHLQLVNDPLNDTETQFWPIVSSYQNMVNS